MTGGPLDPLLSLALAGAAAFVAGALNAVAGGGSLLTFPTLTALGLPPVVANLTNTVALCPGYLGATHSQRRDLAGQGRRIAYVLPVSALGGVAGALLLLNTAEGVFDVAVPFLLLIAALLVGAQDPLRRWLFGREREARSDAWAIAPVALASIYGGYFGAGMGVMILAALGIVLSESLVRLNALKQLVALVTNVTAAAVFLGSGRVEWPYVAVMSLAALAGGAAGGRLATRVPAPLLRRLIVGLGLALSAVYFAKLL